MALWGAGGSGRGGRTARGRASPSRLPGSGTTGPTPALPRASWCPAPPAGGWCDAGARRARPPTWSNGFSRGQGGCGGAEDHAPRVARPRRRPMRSGVPWRRSRGAEAAGLHTSRKSTAARCATNQSDPATRRRGVPAGVADAVLTALRPPFVVAGLYPCLRACAVWDRPHLTRIRWPRDASPGESQLLLRKSFTTRRCAVSGRIGPFLTTGVALSVAAVVVAISGGGARVPTWRFRRSSCRAPATPRTCSTTISSAGSRLAPAEFAEQPVRGAERTSSSLAADATYLTRTRLSRHFFAGDRRHPNPELTGRVLPSSPTSAGRLRCCSTPVLRLPRCGTDDDPSTPRRRRARRARAAAAEVVVAPMDCAGRPTGTAVFGGVRRRRSSN